MIEDFKRNSLLRFKRENQRLDKRKLITLARIINGLTIFRIFLGFPVIISLTNGNNNIFVVLILVGGLTDFFDGFLARKYNHQSVLGAKLDPLADKILLLGPFIWLVHENLIPLWAICLIISRELLITSWRSEKSSGGPASTQGKYKTTLQFISVILLLWPKNWGPFYIINIINKFGLISFWLALFLSLSSGINYVINQKATHQN